VNNLMIFAAIDFVSLLPFALFGAIAIGAWVLIDIVFNSKTKTESRLEQMKNRAQGKSEVLKESGGAKEGITKLLESASPKLSEALKPKSEKEINSLRQKLNEAGFRSENAPALLSTLKVLAGGFGFIFGGGIALFTSGGQHVDVALLAGSRRAVSVCARNNRQFHCRQSQAKTVPRFARRIGSDGRLRGGGAGDGPGVTPSGG
jgi:hypothetical protein